jgi:hypothetical protein
MRKVARAGRGSKFWGLVCIAGGILWLAGAQINVRAQVPEVADAPKELSWQARIAPLEEPGAPRVISGQVYTPDGEALVAGITVYAYHTDAQGLCTRDGSFRTPPRLRG